MLDHRYGDGGSVFQSTTLDTVYTYIPYKEPLRLGLIADSPVKLLSSLQVMKVLLQLRYKTKQIHSADMKTSS